MSEFFPDVPKITYGGPKSRNPLEFKHYNAGRGGRRQDDARSTCGSRSSTGTRSATRSPTRSAPGTALRPWDDGSRLGRQRPDARRRWPSSSSRSSGAPFYAFHDRDVAPEGKTLAREPRQPRRGRQGPQGRAGTHRRQAALGHGQPLHATRATCTARPPARTSTSSPSPPRRSRRRWRSPTSSAARATPSGAAARATRPCSTPT